MFDTCFSLENETSINVIYNYYAKMAQCRNIQEIPLILVELVMELVLFSVKGG